MSKQDFIALADVIREHNRIASHPANSDMPKFEATHLEALVSFMRGQSSNFMKERWLGYVAGENGPSGGKVGR
jgi:hypothetical protein